MSAAGPVCGTACPALPREEAHETLCRIAAYCGPPLPLSALLTEPERSLERQSRDAREMADWAWV